MTRRPPGVRSVRLGAMTAIAVVSVTVTGLLARAEVAAELTDGDTLVSADVEGCVVRGCVKAGLVAAVLALALALAFPLVLRMARTLRRRDVVATQMANAEAEMPAAGAGRGPEIGELRATSDRLTATMREQDQVRRATAADVAHELNGALAVLMGNIEAVEDGVLGRAAGLSRIAGDARRLGRLVDDVQRLVEAQRPSLLVRTRTVDVAAVVRDRVRAYAHRFEAASIALEPTIRPASADGDPERLAQVVDNLLANALRYTDPGGRVTVSLVQTPAETVLDVADSGIGIRPEHVARIFDRFWRAPAARARAREGSGIGLALVRDLVAAHQGHVEVESRLGIGSRFRVRLPRRHLSSPPGEPAPRAAAGATAAPVWHPRVGAHAARPVAPPSATA